MTVSPSNIWKSAAAILREPSEIRGKNMHIGKTLRDLYVDDALSSSSPRLTTLLDELHAAEKAKDNGLN